MRNFSVWLVLILKCCVSQMIEKNKIKVTCKYFVTHYKNKKSFYILTILFDRIRAARTHISCTNNVYNSNIGWWEKQRAIKNVGIPLLRNI